MRYPLLIFLGMLPFLVAGQTFELSGRVKDAQGQPLPYANTILFMASDSTQVAGISSDDTGFFKLSGIAPGLYYLQAQYFGYESRLVALEINSNLTIGAIILEPNGKWLDEVVVSGQRPTVERRPDRIIFNVANTVIGEGTSWDILRNAPGVVIVQDNLEIRGKEATVYLNDRKVQLSQSEIQDFLKGLSGDIVSSVEVIPNPPASFEAEDGPVLNIRTNANVNPGYKGNIRTQFTQGIFPKYSFGTSHYFKSDKVGLFTNYVINPRKEFQETNTRVNYINSLDDVFARWNTELGKTIRSQAQQLNLILDYNPSERDRFNFTSNVNISPNKEMLNEVETIMRDANGNLDSTLQNRSRIEEDQLNLSFDLNYERRLKKEGASIKANAHYTYYELARLQTGSSDYFDASGNFLRNFGFSTDALQGIDIYTGQVDYLTPVKSGTFEGGIKGSLIESSSRIDFFDINDNRPPFDIELSDNFSYQERVLAAYTSLSQAWGDWALKVGLRAEQTDVKTRSETLLETNNQSYLELFPSLYLTRKMGEDHSLTFDYSRKLARPDYADLNPFRYFLNENEFDQGNPNLVPNFSHNFNLNFTIKDTYFIDFYYRDNGRYISSLSFQDNINQLVRESYQNVQESISYGLDFTISTSITPFWYLYAYNSVFYEDETLLAEESAIETYTNKVTGFYANLNNSFTLSKDGSFTGETALTYLSGFLNGSYKMSETISLNMGLRKSLWDNRAILSLTVEDILGRANASFTSRYANQDNSFKTVPETQFVRLGFTYNFGNYRLSNNARTLQKSELQRLENE
ncbi:MAG: TonB-dependent receptor [Flavobacteriaceae bacterium]|nr:TonB-dependent receptor family protein [Eudoraea sp.]NNJ37835.1 TonB-dependent receptor [Flavobacteriaceae bacterium]